MIFFDTETCGLHGPIILIQYAVDDGEIILWDVWKKNICDTLELIEMLVDHPGGVCGFNLAFDWFHICQLYTTLRELVSVVGDDHIEPQDYIMAYASCESKARDGLCLKPVTALDLMLHARKGPYQSTMDRKDITIKKIPTPLAWDVANELTKRIPINKVYFARKSNPNQRWQVDDISDDDGNLVPDFKNIVLRFAPSSALKALAQDALGVDPDKIKMFSDVDLPKKALPVELGYAPFATAIGGEQDWKGAWPEVISLHISHWGYSVAAREYATDDVVYTRELYKYFECPDAGDDDSILACMVGAIRWHGYRVDIGALETLKSIAEARLDKSEHNFNSVRVCRTYLEQVLDEVERKVIAGSTGKIILEEIVKWKEADVCDKCNGEGCHDCNDGFVPTDTCHPAAERAAEILEFRRAKKEIELYDKLLTAGRFHASFVVIGTLSSRMAGGDGLNAQGIKNSPATRAAFPLAFDDTVLCGGDFDGFEVTLMDAAYSDPKLRADLLSGKKIHGLFGMKLFPGKSYDDILATKGLPGDQDLYARSKTGVFAVGYGGEAYTVHNKVGIPMEQAEEAYQEWIKDYVVWGKERKKIFDQFCSMRQPGGIGSKVEWHEPNDYIESLFGFRRYFTLENRICKVLFGLAERPPRAWNEIKIKVVRRDREQTASGACRSAMFAAAFAIQASNMRAAANHVIQSSGGTITKGLEIEIWKVQPQGITTWVVMPMNIHDEIMCPTHPNKVGDVESCVDNFVKALRNRVPLIAMEWRTGLETWASK